MTAWTSEEEQRRKRRQRILRGLLLGGAAIGLPAMDPRREAEQVARLRALAAESGLDPAFTEAFLRFILDEVIRHHEEFR